MSGNPMGAAKTAAKKIGITVEACLANKASGNKWCHTCRRFIPAPAFPANRKRRDKLGCECKSCSTQRKKVAAAVRRSRRSEW